MHARNIARIGSNSAGVVNVALHHRQKPICVDSVASIPATLNGTISLHDTAITDVTATIALTLAYLKGVSPDA